MYQSSRSAVTSSRVCVTPKRLLAERLLRSVEARKSVGLAPSSSVPRFVEVRRVLASGVQRSVLPRLFASRWEAPRVMLSRMVHRLKRTATAKKSVRLAERFAGSRCVESQSVASEFVASVASKSRLN
jgi:hypothetical protein